MKKSRGISRGGVLAVFIALAMLVTLAVSDVARVNEPAGNLGVSPPAEEKPISEPVVSEPAPEAATSVHQSASRAEEAHIGAVAPSESSAPGNMTNIPGYAPAPEAFLQDRVVDGSGSGKAYGLGSMRSIQQQETAQYGEYGDNAVRRVASEPVSTFGLDVDTASYANVRRFLNSGRLPPQAAIRVEEMINYFPSLRGEWNLQPLNGSPFRVGYELAPCPWDGENLLLWIAVNAYGVDFEEAPPANLVFLVDVSGSMSPPERLPLVKSSLSFLAGRLRPQDRISIVTYANNVRVVLPPISGKEQETIRRAINSLSAAGGTAGGEGLQTSYRQAEEAFIKGGINRILLCTDGDFNIGVSDPRELKEMVSRQRRKGVTLSVLGYGTDNLNDAMMVQIADAGNGNYSYIDTLSEAQKVLSEEMASTLITVAKDVKAQIEFNPTNVQEYRQIGYEKRQLRTEDFNDDRVDAGDIGAGRRVTVLYELTPVGAKTRLDPLRYQSGQPSEPAAKTVSGDAEMAYLKLRWKEPEGEVSSAAEMSILKAAIAPSFERAGISLRFSAAAAAFGMKLRDAPQLSGTGWNKIAGWAEAARGDDKGGYRAEMVRLLGLAEGLEK